MKLLYNLIGKELSRFARYFDNCYLLSHSSLGELLLKDSIEFGDIQRLKSINELPNDNEGKTDLIVLNGTLNYYSDVQELFAEIYKKSSRRTRIAVVAYNSYLKPIYMLANLLGLRSGPLPPNFLTLKDYENLAKLSGHELVKCRSVAYCPVPLLFLDKLINFLAPFIPFASFFSPATVLVFRPVIKSSPKTSLSIVIPARNEFANIESAIVRLENLQNIPHEIIFIEGGSTDNTWPEIQRVQEKYKYSHKIQAYRQTGVGKNDAVMMGFSRAQCELLTILDADLTTEPEHLIRFYNAYVSGQGDFINGNRLVLPMESQAMQFLNKIGNVLFAKTLGYLLSLNIGDSLCGTKLFSKSDYKRMLKWREDFGDYDPFGDFNYLFAASDLCLGSQDVPVMYKARVYGQTNISRFQHGWMLLKMTLVGLLKVKAGRA